MRMAAPDVDVLDDCRSLFPEHLGAEIRSGIERAFRSHDLTRPPTHMAGLVYDALTGRPAPRRLTTIATLVHVGAGLHDDVADGDIDGGRVCEAQALLVSGVCLATLAPRALLSLVPPASAQRALDVLWTGMETMASGQARDVGLFGANDAGLRDVEAALDKTAGEIGISTALAALAAEQHPDDVRTWQTFGADVGYAIQLASDCQDVVDAAGRDLGSGARTLPIAFTLSELSGERRAAFVDALARAHDDAAARAQARALVLETHALNASLTLVEARVARAERALASLAPPHPAGLAAFLDGISWLRRR